jgi:hypothetical protein
MTVEKVCEIIDEITEAVEDLNARYTIGEITMVEYEREVNRAADINVAFSKLSHGKDKQLAETLIAALLVSISL